MNNNDNNANNHQKQFTFAQLLQLADPWSTIKTAFKQRPEMWKSV